MYSRRSIHRLTTNVSGGLAVSPGAAGAERRPIWRRRSASTRSSSRTARPRSVPGTRTSRSTIPPLKLVLVEGHGRAGHAEPPRRRGRLAPRRSRAAQRRLRGEGLATTTEDEVELLLRGAGQGVGGRPRRGALGDLHGARRRRDARRVSCGRVEPGGRCRVLRRRHRSRRRGAARRLAGIGSWRAGRRPRPLGTAFLVAIVVGSGIAAQRLSPQDRRACSCSMNAVDHRRRAGGA